MRIIGAEVRMKSEYAYCEQRVLEESFQYWDNRASDAAAVSISSEARRQFAQFGSDHTRNAPEAVAAHDNDGREVVLEISEEDKAKIRMLEKLFEEMTHKPFKFLIADKIILDKGAPVKLELQDESGKETVVDLQGWGLDYRRFESYAEKESAAFRASVSIQTADGRTIELDVQLEMSRSFESTSSLRIQAGDAKLKDPLVINLNRESAQLTEQKYDFDIDGDGATDRISFVVQGSGFLALDRNGDGAVSDGTELFGALSGNGFAELAQYDADGNGWIDKADPVFDRLLIWMKDERGNDRLAAIGQAGVGAIYIGHADTPFSLVDGRQSMLGAVRKTGVYVTEQGRAGTIQQIDLAV